jgi:hypothetical protein
MATLSPFLAPNHRPAHHGLQPSWSPFCHDNEPNQEHPGWTHSDQRGSEGNYPMSRLFTKASQPEQTTPQPSIVRSPISIQASRWGNPRDKPMEYPVLPPLLGLATTSQTPDHRHSNPIQPILNSEAGIVEQQRNRKRSAFQMETSSQIGTPNSQGVPPISRLRNYDWKEQHLRPFEHLDRSLARHTFDPKSPRLHTTQGLDILNSPTETINACHAPFLTASTALSDPKLSNQSLPTATANGRHSRTIASSGPLSHSAQMHKSRLSVGLMTVEREMIPMAPSGQSSTQLMTIKSQQGHNVQIPVDVQADSKVADEKRRRNAGASTRFRARRKEKEREASMSISRLEQQLQNAEQDARFYREERDRYRELYLQQRPDIPGELSPRLNRPALSSIPQPFVRGSSEDSHVEYEEECRC